MNNVPRARIRIYTNIRQTLEFAKRIYEKHMADGDSSLLSTMDGFTWDATGPKISFCLEKHKEAIGLSKDLEEMYRQRDAVLAEINDIVGASKSLLKSKYTVNPEKLCGWDFVVRENNGITEIIPP